MSSFPYIFTFYSYKGGVGRSMALLNVAYTLAHRARHVLVLDLDLEAPGLSDFLHRHGELTESKKKNAGDMIDLVAEVKRLALARTHPDQAVAELGDVARFVRPVKASKVPAPRLGLKGHLDVICALLGDQTEGEYWSRLTALNLKGVGNEDLQRMGLILARFLQAQRLTVTPLGWSELGLTESVPYDYILVDSRTGITELGGLCVGPLCDRLVVCTALNEQNINGTRAFLEEAGIEPKARNAKDFSPWDQADPEPGEGVPETMGPKPTLIVATPVPSGEIEYKRRRKEELQKILGPICAQLSYHPQMALMESIFVREYSEEYLAQEYRGLADHLMASVMDHHVQLAQRSMRISEEKRDAKESVDMAIRIAGHNTEAGAAILMQLGNSLSNDSDEQVKMLLKVCGLLAGLGGKIGATAWINFGDALSAQAERVEGDASTALFEASYEKYAEAVKIKPDNYEAWYNWGYALSAQAERVEGDASTALFEASYEKYAQAVKIKPDQDEAWYIWGTALVAQALGAEGDATRALFEASYEKYAQAVKINPGNDEAWNRWGIALSTQAKRVERDASTALFEASYAKYAQAVKIKPDQDKVWNNWGKSLSDQAQRLEGAAATRLFEASYEKFARAIELKPDDHTVWTNWGAVLSIQSKGVEGAAAARLFEASYEKHARALEIEPDDQVTLFNLGCHAALQGKVADAVNYLQGLKQSPAELLKKISDDSDFDRIREDRRFNEFLTTLKAASGP